jgi:arginase
MLKRCSVIGGSYGLGAGIRAAKDGPRALRDAGLIERLKALGVSVVDLGDQAEPSGSGSPGDPKLKNLEALLEFSAQFGPRCEAAWLSSDFLLVLGGDHSISISSIAYAARAVKAIYGENAELGVLWVDAHGDVHTRETTPSGNIHGMALSALLGFGDSRLCGIGGGDLVPKIKPDNVAYIGVRDLEVEEREFIRRERIACFTMKEVDLLGIGEVCRRAYERVSRNTVAFIVSLDLDACDPEVTPAVGTGVRGGLTWREVQLIVEMAAENTKFRSLELIEYAPERDVSGRTGELGISLAESGLGKVIL